MFYHVPWFVVITDIKMGRPVINIRWGPRQNMAKVKWETTHFNIKWANGQVDTGRPSTKYC